MNYKLLGATLAAIMLIGCSTSEKAPTSSPAAPVVKQPDVVKKYFTLTAEQEQAAKDAVIATLKDPESARFKSVVGVGDPDGTGAYSVCGSVNAKNSYGGYVGDRLFAAASGQVFLWSNTQGAKSFDNRMILLLCKPTQ